MDIDTNENFIQVLFMLQHLQMRLYVQQGTSHLREERKRNQRYVTEIETSERIDIVADGYSNGINDFIPSRPLPSSRIVRLLKKALKTTTQEHLEHKYALAHELTLLTTPKSVKEVLASPQ